MDSGLKVTELVFLFPSVFYVSLIFFGLPLALLVILDLLLCQVNMLSDCASLDS